MGRTGLLKRRISAWGDSMVDTLTPRQEGWTDFLRPMIGRGVQMRGVGGETSLATRTRFEAEPWTWRDVTIIWTGGNDFSNPPYWTQDIINVRTNVQAMVDHLASVGNSSYYIVSIINGFGVAEDAASPVIRNAALARRGLMLEWEAQHGLRYIDSLNMLVAQDPTEIGAVTGRYMPYVVRETRMPQTHPNLVGQRLIARQIYDRIVLLGD